MRIGIPGWKTGENSFGCSIPYLEFISRFGEAVILQPNSKYDDTINLIVVPGGADTSPMMYNQPPNYRTGSNDPFKDHFAYNMLPKYIANNIPVLGICLGAQQLIALHGGKLVQHYNFDYTANRQERSEELTFVNTPNVLMNRINKNNYKVNSMHHQGIYNVPEHFDIIAKSKKFSNVEIFMSKDETILGVQYHPEEIFDELVINWMTHQKNKVKQHA